MEELEITYLLKKVPEGLHSVLVKELLDVYIPSTSEHPKLRIRKLGDIHEITKKVPVDNNDASRQIETTIPLTQEEYTELSQLSGKRIRKLRYYYYKDGTDFEVDIFQDALKGLVVVDVEFDSIEKKNAFKMPDFCLVDITQEKFIAGGELCGKSYSDIEKDLARFGYVPIFLD